MVLESDQNRDNSSQMATPLKVMVKTDTRSLQLDLDTPKQYQSRLLVYVQLVKHQRNVFHNEEGNRPVGSAQALRHLPGGLEHGILVQQMHQSIKCSAANTTTVSVLKALQVEFPHRYS